jgi:hypothetical protein
MGRGVTGVAPKTIVVQPQRYLKIAEPLLEERKHRDDEWQ